MIEKVKGCDYMFCMHCGKQLEDGSKFCMFCGNALTPAPVPQTEEPTVAAAPEMVSPEPQETYYAPPAPQPPVEPAPIPRDANVYSDPVPPAPKKKKKGKKTGAIIAVILVLLLLIGGGVGFYFYSQKVYEENLAAYEAAELLLDKGDYDGALDGFLALDDFEDAASRAKELQKLQKEYDEALALLDDNKFEDALDAFEDLGDYRESKVFVEYEITYREAWYLKDSAADAVDSDAIGLYETAADYFAGLGDYADAADQASDCLLQAALLELSYENYDAALAYKDQLNSADAAHLDDAYAEVCADGAFLKDIAEAMVLWYDEEDKYTYGEEVELAWAMMEPYANAHFNDPDMLYYLDQFEYAMQTIYNSLSDEDSVDLWSEFYLGSYYLFTLADELYYNHGVFAGDVNLQDQFVGVSEIYYAYHTLESSFEYWWDNGVSADQMDDGHYYAAYYNDTGYSFNLYATIYFYDNYDNLLEVSDEMVIYVAKGATVYIPCIPETVSDSAWYTWGMMWDFGDVS